MRETRSASFRIDSEQWDKFINKAKENNTDSSKLLRDWIDAYLSDSVINNQTDDNYLIERVSQIEAKIEPYDTTIAALSERLAKLEKDLGI